MYVCRALYTRYGTTEVQCYIVIAMSEVQGINKVGPCTSVFGKFYYVNKRHLLTAMENGFFTALQTVHVSQ